MRTPLPSKHDSLCGMFRTIEPMSYENNQIKCLICVVNNRCLNRSAFARSSKNQTFLGLKLQLTLFGLFWITRKFLKGPIKKIEEVLRVP